MFQVLSRPLWAILLLAGIALSGCGGSEQFQVTTDIIPYTAEEQAARADAAAARYRLRGGDVISVSFKYETDFDQSDVIVLPDGYVNVKGIDSGIKAAGLTIEELDDSLTNVFAKDIKNPTLSVIVQAISDPEVYVVGMVRNPGMVKLPWQGVGVLQAVTAAGGFLETANTSEVAVLRAGEEGFMIRVADLSHIESMGIGDLALFDVQPYDIVYVPRSSLGNFAYLTKAVFGSALNVSSFFWDVYAIAHLNKIDRIVR
jgi:polysaccharide export outer membrane protein